MFMKYLFLSFEIIFLAIVQSIIHYIVYDIFQDQDMLCSEVEMY
jgi:hypothetical protein